MTAPAFTLVQGRFVPEDSEAEATQLEAQAARLMQRARDIRHTLKLNAVVAARVLPARCIECDAEIETVHFGWCSFNGPEAFTVVE